MKKYLLFLLVLIAWHDPAFAESGIKFETDSFSVLVAKAKQQHKLIFIDCYTAWCGPCKWMEKNVFPNDTAAGFYNSNFLCASFDMEKGEGIALRTQYDVRCYPTCLFIDTAGKVVHRQSGAFPVSKFVELGQTALSAEKRFAAAEASYAAGTIIPSELIRYMAMRQATCLPVDAELAAYAKTQPDSSFTNRQNWSVIRTYVNTPACSMFRYLLAHRSAFEVRYTTDSVQLVIERVYGSAMSKCLWTKIPDTLGYDSLRVEALRYLASTDALILNMDMRRYEIVQDWNKYAVATTAYVRQYGSENAIILNNIAWTFYENITDPAYLDTALVWVRESMRLDPGHYYNTDTYAALLYKRGRKKEAKQAAKEAISFAEKENVEATETKELLRKIKEM